MRTEQRRLVDDGRGCAPEAANHVDPGPLDVRAGWPVATTETGRSSELARECVDFDVGAFAAYDIVGGLGDIASIYGDFFRGK